MKLECPICKSKLIMEEQVTNQVFSYKINKNGKVKGPIEQEFKSIGSVFCEKDKSHEIPEEMCDVVFTIIDEFEDDIIVEKRKL